MTPTPPKDGRLGRALGYARPLTGPELRAWSRWFPDFSVHDVIAFKVLHQTSRFGVIRGGKA